jgi:hypothetical protein
MAISMYLNFNFRYNIKAYTKCKNISSFAREDFLLISTCNKRERERDGGRKRDHGPIRVGPGLTPLTPTKAEIIKHTKPQIITKKKRSPPTQKGSPTRCYPGVSIITYHYAS